MFTEDLNERAVQRRILQREKLEESVIDESHPLGAVRDQHTLHHSGKDRAEAEFLIGDLTVELLEKLGNLPDIPDRRL
ncbi:MAG: hypothetical protein ACOYM3_23915 [Terrimicrobiaceae bacterium]